MEHDRNFNNFATAHFGLSLWFVAKLNVFGKDF